MMYGGVDTSIHRRFVHQELATSSRSCSDRITSPVVSCPPVY